MAEEEETRMGCWTFMRTPSSLSRRGYRALRFDGDDPVSGEPVMMVVVGKEKRVFLVDPALLEKYPFRILMGMMEKKEKKRKGLEFESAYKGKEVIFVDVDAILFEHMLWLVQNDCSSLVLLNFEEIIEFYAQD